MMFYYHINCHFYKIDCIYYSIIQLVVDYFCVVIKDDKNRVFTIAFLKLID